MELDAALDWVDESEYVDDDGEYKSAFVVDSDEKAAWALRKYNAAILRISEAEEFASAEMLRIEDWLNGRRSVYGRDVEFFGSLLSHYALSQREQFDRKKVDLPDGVIQTRTINDKFTIEDKDLFVEWARENAPDLLRVSYSPDMSAITERCVMAGSGAVEEKTGSVIPGVTVRPGFVSANIKIS